MTTGIEPGLLHWARIAAGSVFLLVFGLVSYGVGGSLFLVESFELSYSFLDVNRDPILNLFLVLIGLGMFLTSLPVLLLATLFGQDGLDLVQVVLSTILGGGGLALVRLSVFNIG